MKIKLLLLAIFLLAIPVTAGASGHPSTLNTGNSSEQLFKKRSASHARIRKSKSKKSLAKGRTPRKSKESRKGSTVNIM